jgi:hypothetical protein
VRAGTYSFHALDIDVFASWTLEGKQFESRIFRLYAEQPAMAS